MEGLLNGVREEQSRDLAADTLPLVCNTGAAFTAPGCHEVAHLSGQERMSSSADGQVIITASWKLKTHRTRFSNVLLS